MNIPSSRNSIQFGRGTGSGYSDPMPLKMYYTRRFFEDRLTEGEFNNPDIRKYINLNLLPKVKKEIQQEAQEKMLRQFQTMYQGSPYGQLFQQGAPGMAPPNASPLMSLLQDPQALSKLQALKDMVPPQNAYIPAARNTSPSTLNIQQ